MHCPEPSVRSLSVRPDGGLLHDDRRHGGALLGGGEEALLRGLPDARRDALLPCAFI